MFPGGYFPKGYFPGGYFPPAGDGGVIIAGPYRIAQLDVYVAGVIRGHVFKAGATQSVCFVAGSERGQVR